MALSYIIPSIAEDYEVCFGASAELTALLFLTPATVAQLISAPLIGRLAVRIGFVTVLRAGLTGAVPVGALLAIFAFDRNVVILLIPVLGFAFGGVAGTALSVLGVMQARADEPGVAAGPEQCRLRCRLLTRIRLGRADCRAGHGGGVSLGVVDQCRNRRRRPGYEPGSQAQDGGNSSGLRRALALNGSYWRTGQPEMASSSCAGPVPLVGSVFHGQSLERNGARLGSCAF